MLNYIFFAVWLTCFAVVVFRLNVLLHDFFLLLLFIHVKLKVHPCIQGTRLAGIMHTHKPRIQLSVLFVELVKLFLLGFLNIFSQVCSFVLFYSISRNIFTYLCTAIEQNTSESDLSCIFLSLTPVHVAWLQKRVREVGVFVRHHHVPLPLTNKTCVSV